MYCEETTNCSLVGTQQILARTFITFVGGSHLVRLNTGVLQLVIVFQQVILLVLKEVVHVLLRVGQQELVARLLEGVEEPRQLLLCVLRPHIELCLILQKYVKVAVILEGGVASQPLKEHLVLGDLPAQLSITQTVQYSRRTVFLNVARYSASNSCFILLNSSLVSWPDSASPSFCSFSRLASKSGVGGLGGIMKPAYSCAIPHSIVVNNIE